MFGNARSIARGNPSCRGNGAVSSRSGAFVGALPLLQFVLAVVVIAALGFFVPLVFCVLELSSRYPEDGGVYVWSKRAFGPFAGFITGWTYWGSNLPYLPGLLYYGAANALFTSTFTCTALAAITAGPINDSTVSTPESPH